MIEAEPLAEALGEACRAAGVSFVDAAVVRATPAGAAIRAVLTTGDSLRGDLLVAADGARSRAARSGADRLGRLVLPAGRHRGDHRPRAAARGARLRAFPPRGSVRDPASAGRGRPGHRSSIVWTERADEAEALLSGEPDEVLREIERRFTLDLGATSRWNTARAGIRCPSASPGPSGPNASPCSATPPT